MMKNYPVPTKSFFSYKQIVEVVGSNMMSLFWGTQGDCFRFYSIGMQLKNCLGRKYEKKSYSNSNYWELEIISLQVKQQI